MHNDDRDDRRDAEPVDDRRPDDPERDAPIEDEDEDEFETATWPSRDSQRTADEIQAAETPAPQETWPTAERAPAEAEAIPSQAEVEPEQGEAPAPSDEPAAESADQLPPPDVEAYPPPAQTGGAPMAAHSVPATEPGESTLCPRCGTENRPGIAFCRSCGQRLVAAGAPSTVARPSPPEGTQACPRCGTHNRAGVAFCQNCGANLRAAAEGYIPPAVEPAPATAGEAEGGRALLGPIVLVIGALGIIAGWLLPFLIGEGSLFDQAFGSADGYGIAFWVAYDRIPTLASQAYFGFAAPSPLLAGLLFLLAVGGFLRPAPAVLQLAGLAIALVWAIGLVVLFVLVEVVGGPGGELLDILRALSPGGIILMLASLIVVIGALTRIGRS